MVDEKVNGIGVVGTRTGDGVVDVVDVVVMGRLKWFEESPLDWCCLMRSFTKKNYQQLIRIKRGQRKEKSDTYKPKELLRIASFFLRCLFAIVRLAPLQSDSSLCLIPGILFWGQWKGTFEPNHLLLDSGPK